MGAELVNSGVRNLFKYSKFYSGKDPEIIEGDIFRTIVPLNDRNMEEDITQSTTQFTQSRGKNVEQAIIRLIEQEPVLSQKQMAENLVPFYEKRQLLVITARSCC